VVYEKNRKVLYVQVMRAIYRMLEAAYYGIRSSEENWNKQDSSLILMTHVTQTKLRKDHSLGVDCFAGRFLSAFGTAVDLSLPGSLGIPYLGITKLQTLATNSLSATATPMTNT
jgi:hypothetical protein